MSKKNNNNQHLMQRIREQQAEIDALKCHTNDLRNIIRDMRENKFATYSEVMLVIFEGFMMDDLTEEQAGQLMLSLTNVMMYNNE